MKTQQQIEKFIETVENLIPKLEEKKLEYSRQGDEFCFNVMKDKIKERLIELNMDIVTGKQIGRAHV